jgi:hypothetical protein
MIKESRYRSYISQMSDSLDRKDLGLDPDDDKMQLLSQCHRRNIIIGLHNDGPIPYNDFHLLIFLYE